MNIIIKHLLGNESNDDFFLQKMNGKIEKEEESEENKKNPMIITEAYNAFFNELASKTK